MSSPMMVRRFPALALLLCVFSLSALRAQEGAGNTPAGDELKDLRRMLEQQSKQLDVLAQEVARLNLLLSKGGANLGTATNSPAPATSPAGETEGAPKAEAAASSTPEAGSAKAPAAAPGAGGMTHEVTKGETLTSIAKHYKVTVAELLKVNKITDVKKLQIGQTVALPPDAKPLESPTPEQH